MTEPAWELLGPDPLGENYSPTAYWRMAGEIYESTYSPEAYLLQEAALSTILAPLDWHTVLDVGCGFGRLGEMLRRIRPDCHYTGIDVSPDQIDAAEWRVPGAELHVSPILDFDPGDRQWDLVVSAEVLMHQPDALIAPTVQRMLSWSRCWVATVDACDGEQNAWNRIHDYATLYGDSLIESHRVDAQMIWLLRVDNPSEEH